MPRTAPAWLDEISRYRAAYQKWTKEGKRVVERYRLERAMGGDRALDVNSQGGRPSFNVLWSNVQTQKPAIFSRLPQIVAERRHKDRDPLGRVAAEVLQRAANEEVEANGFKDAMDSVVLDVLLPGRGVPWVRFEALELDDGTVTNERVAIDYVHWDDFAHSLDRVWADVQRTGWVARRVALTRAEGIARFGSKFSRVELTMTSRTAGDTKAERDTSGTEYKYAEVWEIWNKPSRKRLFVSKGLGKPLQEDDDPYGIETFFPCPRPAYATLTNEDLMPIPDYLQYVDLAEELDTITWRIKRLTQALKLAGYYDASVEGLGRVLQANDGELIGISGMQTINAKGGVNNVVEWMPIADVANTLAGLYAAREQAKQVLYEVSGISDVIRGQVDPREKASQSQIKAQFAGQRLDQRRRGVERCARDTARIMTELMIELYPQERLREQSGFDQIAEITQVQDPNVVEQMWEQVYGLLQNDRMRGFRLDVETDSTIEMDAQNQQQARTEFLQSAGSFLNNALPLIQAAPNFAPVLGDMLLFAVRSYRTGRTLEARFEDAVRELEQMTQQAQQQGGQQADPEAEAKAAEAQQRMQVEAQKAQADLARTQQQAQVDAQKGAIEVQRMEQEREIEAQKGALEVQKLQQSVALDAEKAQIQREKAARDAQEPPQTVN